MDNRYRELILSFLKKNIQGDLLFKHSNTESHSIKFCVLCGSTGNNSFLVGFFSQVRFVLYSDSIDTKVSYLCRREEDSFKIIDPKDEKAYKSMIFKANRMSCILSKARRTVVFHSNLVLLKSCSEMKRFLIKNAGFVYFVSDLLKKIIYYANFYKIVYRQVVFNLTFHGVMKSKFNTNLGG